MRFHVLIAILVFAAGPALAQNPPPADLMLETVASGFDRPVAIIDANDGSNRLFIVEQDGMIRIYDRNTDTVLPTPFLDIRTEVDSTLNEQGLLGLAFHPDFTTNDFFYVSYTRDPGPGLDRTRIERYTVDDANPNLADTSTAFTVLETPQDDWNHNGGNIAFGPDGYLYIGLGDGGGGGDPNNRAQDLSNLLGAFLRIDVDGSSPPMDTCALVANFGIPGDNPNVGDTMNCGDGDDPCDCAEIWSHGWRNPWRWSFDRDTGDLWAGDVGQGAREEINLQPASSSGGENWGWSCKEGFNTPNFNPCLPEPLTDPVFDYSHASGRCSVTGGFVYRGTSINMSGTYFYADYCTGEVWYLLPDGVGGWTSTLWQNLPFNVTSFGEDAAGELYISGFDGNIYRFTSAGTIFTDSFESGDVSAWSSAVP
ncbi:MAG: PQQ-dependent sugar dehydrogenase [Acidobacteriota bacterium]